jgi:mannose-6-phosphate isomerase-like protein (cupin superfamily)
MSTAALDRMHIPEGVGEAMACFGTTVTFKVTRDMSRGAYTIFETSAPPGTGIPMHIHHKDEESIFVIEGRIIVRVGELACKAGKGDCCTYRRGYPTVGVPSVSSPPVCS